MKDDSGTTLKACPICKTDDELDIDSSNAMGLTEVTCACGHSFQSRCYEENIGRHWNKHCRMAEGAANANRQPPQ